MPASVAPDPPDLSPERASRISRAHVEDALAHVTASKTFSQSRRHRELLRHLVVNALAGTTGALKEPVLAYEFFKRPLATFDPARDTIVRVEARRLRHRLAHYYATEGVEARIEIQLPVGSYVPTIRQRDAAGGTAATRRAKDLVERGEYFLRQPLSRDSLEQARARFDEALRESPAYVSALVGLARTWYNLAVGWHHPPRAAADHAAEALSHALVLDPAHATAHALLGSIVFQFEYDWPRAKKSLRKAVALAPEQAFVHSAYGYNLLVQGDLPAAERELALARRLDPHYVNARLHMVNLRVAQGRLDDAQAELDAMLDIAPDSMPATAMSGLLAMMRHDPDAALARYERVLALAPQHPNAHASVAAALGFAGRIEDADAVLARMRTAFGEERASPYVLAVVATRCGRHDEAFARLVEALDVHDPNAGLASTDPSFDDLRQDARWMQLLARPAFAATRPRNPSAPS